MGFSLKTAAYLMTLTACTAISLVSCSGTSGKPTRVVTDGVVVSVRDQKLAVLRNGEVMKTYKVSTSKFGLGDKTGSRCTPLGYHTIAAKIGDNVPKGTVFKSRKPTGEIIKPNSPGRDPIVSRIIWLAGKEPCNRNAYRRMIYIHGTAEERTIGRPASYGCVRMKSSDIIDMYPELREGDPVVIELCSLKASTDAAYSALHPDPSKPSETVQIASVHVAKSAIRKKPSGKKVSKPDREGVKLAFTDASEHEKTVSVNTRYQSKKHG